MLEITTYSKFFLNNSINVNSRDKQITFKNRKIRKHIFGSFHVKIYDDLNRLLLDKSFDYVTDVFKNAEDK